MSGSQMSLPNFSRTVFRLTGAFPASEGASVLLAVFWFADAFCLVEHFNKSTTEPPNCD